MPRARRASYLGRATCASLGLLLATVTVSGCSGLFGSPSAPHGPGTFAPTGSMAIGREFHQATRLSDGRVLITGGERGETSADYLSSAELYDPAIGTFSPTGPMTQARGIHTATLLRDGRVLVTGGSDQSAELYDPATRTFSPTGSMTTTRLVHTATLLRDGRVLIVGGRDGDATLATAELYDPASGTFSLTGSMVTARMAHAATLLADGRVLIVGGLGPLALASAELYDPSTGTFSATGSMITPHDMPVATLLRDGRVFVASGLAGTSNELYDQASGTFTRTGSMTATREFPGFALLSDGRVLFVGGDSPRKSAFDTSPTLLASAELYDPKSGTFGPTGSMTTARDLLTATLLSDGRVLVVGGSHGGGTLTSAELYQP